MHFAGTEICEPDNPNRHSLYIATNKHLSPSILPLPFSFQENFKKETPTTKEERKNKKKKKRKEKKRNERMTTPYFWRQPLQYLRWASHEKPAIFYSIAIGTLGPLTLFVVPPIRHRLGDGPRETIPLTYPGMFLIFFFS